MTHDINPHTNDDTTNAEVVVMATESCCNHISALLHTQTASTVPIHKHISNLMSWPGYKLGETSSALTVLPPPLCSKLRATVDTELKASISTNAINITLRLSIYTT
jgi:hypothetical protein